MTKNNNAHRSRVGAGAMVQPHGDSVAFIVPHRAGGSNALLAQADRQMGTDPARFGLHFLIWLSLFSAKHGLTLGAAKCNR